MDDDITKRTVRKIPEPGRRYDSGRRMPHAGNDVYVPKTRSLSGTSNSEASQKTTRNQPRIINTAKPALPRTKRSTVLRRQMVERAELQRQKTKKVRKIHFGIYSLTAVILVALGSVAWTFKDAIPATKDLFTEKPVLSNSVDSDPEELSTLDERRVPITQNEGTQIGAEAPRAIRIPKIGVEARIVPVGTTLTGEPISPKNIFDVGWYESSGKPGTEGAVTLNGHTAGPTMPGIFARVIELGPGDKIVIERGDGQFMTYTVSKVQEYASGQVDMSAATSPIDPSKKGLNLVTTLTKFSGTQKRIIIFALM